MTVSHRPLPLVSAAGETFGMKAETFVKSIGDSLVESVKDKIKGKAGEIVLGQILALIGFGSDAQAEVLSKLNEIINLLKELQASVDQTRKTILAAISQVDYDTVYHGVAPLVNLNRTLQNHYTNLLESEEAEQPKISRQIINLTKRLIGADVTWHNAIVGSGGQTGLVEAWGRIVFSNASIGSPKGWYDASSAKLTQEHWDFLDAQQAMSVYFLCEFYHKNDQPKSARNLLKAWHKNRSEQVKLLRGVLRPTIEYTTINAKNEPVHGSWKVHALPNNVAISIIMDMMWYLPLAQIPSSPPQVFLDALAIYKKQVASDAILDSGLVNSGYPYFWDISGLDTIVQLVRYAGGTYGGRGSSSCAFKAAMEQRGFVFPPGAESALWTSDTSYALEPVNRANPLFPDLVYPDCARNYVLQENENKPWIGAVGQGYTVDRPALLSGKGFFGYRSPLAILGRHLEPREEDLYWYRFTGA